MIPVTAPTAVCPGEEVTASVFLYGPASEEVPATISVGKPDKDSHAVTATVSFTPSVAGRYLLRVVFDPSLGVRTFPVFVTHPFSNSGVRVEVPVDGCITAWPVNADTVACEREGLVLVASSDGGLFTYEGNDLVTVGEVLWSIDDGGWLERRVFDDGGLALTHRSPNWKSSSLRGQHTSTSAVRLTSTGDVAWLSIDGGVLIEPKENVPPDSVVFERGGVLHSPCLADQCREQARGLIAWEPDELWSASPAGESLLLITQIATAPTDAGTKRFVVSLELQPTRVPSSGGWHRSPLFVAEYSTRGAPPTTEVLVSSQGWSEWPAHRVERVSDDFALLREDSNLFVIAPLPR